MLGDKITGKITDCESIYSYSIAGKKLEFWHDGGGSNISVCCQHLTHSTVISSSAKFEVGWPVIKDIRGYGNAENSTLIIVKAYITLEFEVEEKMQ